MFGKVLRRDCAAYLLQAIRNDLHKEAIDADGRELARLCGATEEEMRLLGALPRDSRGLLLCQLGLIALRERRALRELKELARGTARDAGRALDESATRDVRVAGKASADGEQTTNERALKRRSLFDARQELEGRLSKLSEQKLKALELLCELEERHGTAVQEAGARIIIPDNGRGRVEAGGEADGSG